MGVQMKMLDSRESWLSERGKRIGGSDAACLVGMNPWKSNVMLWREKTGREIPEDISDRPAVRYGTKAEEHLRRLFELDYPEYTMFYEPNNLIINDEYPFAHASVDGLLEDRRGRIGIWECKTTTIQGAAQRAKWNGKIPDNYYCQVLWYMAVVGAEFAVLKAQMKYEDKDITLVTKHYKIEREDVQDDIELLMQAGAEFWKYIEADTEPPLILPRI